MEQQMRLIIELDGPVFDIADAHYAAYHQAAGELGWSRMDQTTYWRLVRTKGREADILPGAKPIKTEQLYETLPRYFETEPILSKFTPRNEIGAVLSGIAKHGTIAGVTLGTNVKTRETLLRDANLMVHFADVVALTGSPAGRPTELRSLSDGDKRTLVVASTDELVRAAATAELFCVAVSAGSCSKPRLHRASPGVVYSSLDDLKDSLESGAEDLVAAGLLPASHLA